MKVLLGFLLFIGALAGIMYYSGVFAFDPDKDAAQVRAAVDQPGASWTTIAGVRAPRRWRAFVQKKKMIDGQEIIYYEPGAEMSFEGNNIADRLAEGSLPGGFTFEYDFGGKSFSVKFDAGGNQEFVADNRTYKDLLNG